MDETERPTIRLLRLSLSLLALLVMLLFPTVAQARAGGVRPPSSGRAINHPSTSQGAIHPVTSGGVLPVTPTPAPTAALATVQPNRGTGVAPILTNDVAAVATQQADLGASQRATAPRGTSRGVAPVIIVAIVVLMLAAGAGMGIGAFFAFCTAVKRRERGQMQGYSR